MGAMTFAEYHRYECSVTGCEETGDADGGYCDKHSRPRSRRCGVKATASFADGTRVSFPIPTSKKMGHLLEEARKHGPPKIRCVRVVLDGYVSEYDISVFRKLDKPLAPPPGDTTTGLSKRNTNMPKTKKNNTSKPATQTSAKPAPNKASEAVVSPNPPASPTPPPVSGVSGDVKAPFPLAFLKSSPIKAADLKAGEKYIVVKCIHLAPEGHFPEHDRNLVTDVALPMTFKEWEELHVAGTSGLTLDGADPSTVTAVQAAYTKGRVAVFNDGREGYALPAWTTVPESDVPLLVFPNTKEGLEDAKELAEFFSARSFLIGWNQELQGQQRDYLIRSANVAELFAWLDKQGLGTLRSAAAAYGLKVKEVFAKEVDLTKAREIVKAQREKIGSDPAVVAKLAKEYTELRVIWEENKKKRDAHRLVAVWTKRIDPLPLGYAHHPVEIALMNAAKDAKKAAQGPKDTAVPARGPNVTITDDGKAKVSVKGGKLSIEDMKKLIAVADAREKAEQEKKAKEAAEAKAKADAEAAKKKEEEAKAAQATKVTSTKAQAPAKGNQPKVKAAKTKLAVPD